MKAARMLIQARRRAGLTQREVARRAGVPQPAVARIERGRVSPTLPTLDRLLRATGYVVEVAPLEGVGVDRTLIRAALSRTAEERVRSARDAGRQLLAFRAASRAARRIHRDGHGPDG
jgi:transcriptional regulator with XRE-family HTH domain